MVVDWRRISSDPNDSLASEKVRLFLHSRVRRYSGTRAEWLASFAKGRQVLDIGGGEHVLDSSKSESWEHKHLARCARSILGIDINESLCRSLNEAGYNFVPVDATSEVDLGTRFDFIFVGDVIEHVNNPVHLVRFALRHLTPSGRAILTTPNPFMMGDPFQVLMRAGSSRLTNRHVNLEHVSWITPTNFHEILRRAGGELRAIWVAESPGTDRWRRAAHRVVRVYSTLLGMKDVSFPEFAYEISNLGSRPIHAR